MAEIPMLHRDYYLVQCSNKLTIILHVCLLALFKFLSAHNDNAWATTTNLLLQQPRMMLQCAKGIGLQVKCIAINKEHKVDMKWLTVQLQHQSNCMEHELQASYMMRVKMRSTVMTTIRR